LTTNAVIEMRHLFAQGKGSTEIAAQYGVNKQTVSKIVHGQRWAHVGGPISTEDRRGKHHSKRPRQRKEAA
jgi:hypothetical protein